MFWDFKSRAVGRRDLQSCSRKKAWQTSRAADQLALMQEKFHYLYVS